ncbi:hypothetical protein R50076_26570 [Gilvimarinus japonicus]
MIEMVISLTILSLIVLATLTALRTLGATQKTLEKRTSEVARMRAVCGFIRNSLDSVYLVTTYKMGRPEGQSFTGVYNAVTYSAPLMLAGGQGGLFTIRLSVSDERRLVIQANRGTMEKFDEMGDSEEPLEYTLADKVDQLLISYRESIDSPWLDSWVMGEHNMAPSHVRIQLQVNGKYWPPIISVIGNG